MLAAKFKEVVFKMVGSAWFDVELDDDVWDYFILPRTIEKFVENHFDCSAPSIYELDIIAGQMEYVLPDEISSVVGIYNEVVGSGQLTPRKYYMENLTNMTDGMSNISMYQANLEQLQITLGWYGHWHFSKMSHTFTLLNPSNLSKIYLSIFKDKSVDALESMMEMPLFMQLASGYLMRYWAQNLWKYEGVRMLNGASFNWKDIQDAGTELVEKTLEEIRDEHSFEPEMLIG